MKPYSFVLLSIFILEICHMSHAKTSPPRPDAQPLVHYLHQHWMFREVGKTNWLPADVPGCVHTDLLSHKLIEDPYYRDNENTSQWIGKTDWEYRLQFDVPADLRTRDHLELIWQGLDTYAEVTLNQQPILKSDNMFRIYRLDVKKLINAGQNELHVIFRSPINTVLKQLQPEKPALPAANDAFEKTGPYTRKAPYHFGWDWGPRLVTSGIWRPVLLEAWNEIRLTDLYLTTEDVTPDRATVIAHISVDAVAPDSITVAIQDLTEHKLDQQQTVNLQPGVNQITLRLELPQPRLWWPNGLGEPFLYQIEATISKNGQLLGRFARMIGIRKLELRQEPDAWGTSFTFVINDVPVFARGANWIPADNFVTRITPARYEQLLGACRDANMNMIRVWGGGIYEADIFYQLCDQMGLLIWHDFMFACALYPGDPAFLENVAQEARDQIMRLRNHPSIVLWCGNNEIEAGYAEWGWKKQVPESAWDDYFNLFHKVLLQACSRFDPTRPYWPSSPSSNLKESPSSQNMGDIHYWNVWHGARPFQEFQQQFPRFISEFGFQSFPSMATINTFTTPADHQLESPVMLVHQKSGRGNHLIREYMLRDYPEPKDFEALVMLSQILQAEGIKIGVEHFRRIKPRCMGALYWQIDDCWPVASWASLDYYGNWKALHYYAQRFYNPVLISPVAGEDTVHIHLISDLPKDLEGIVHWKLLTFKGEILKQDSIQVKLNPFENRIAVELNRVQLLEKHDPRTCLLTCEFRQPQQVLSRNHLYWLPAKELRLPRPKLQIAEIQAAADGFTFTITTDCLARNVNFSRNENLGCFEQNFFDLLPRESIQIHLRPKKPITAAKLTSQLQVSSLTDLFPASHAH